MERKLIRIKLAKTGTFGASGAVITVQMLKEVEETFDGKCPVSLGHYMAKQDWWPSWGNVETIALEVADDGQSAVLYGDVSINETLAEAIDNGMYPGWSISIPARAADGKHYLHHLAFLGAVPPKIRDLEIVKTSDGSVPDNAISATGEGTDFGDYAFFNNEDFADQSSNEDPGSEDPEDPPAGGQTEFSDNVSPGAGENPLIAKARDVLRKTWKEKLDAAAKDLLPAGKEALIQEFADMVMDDSFDFADNTRGPIEILIDILNEMRAKPGVTTGRMDFSDDVCADDRKVDYKAMASKF